jgi:hypothetical protein
MTLRLTIFMKMTVSIFHRPCGSYIFIRTKQEVVSMKQPAIALMALLAACTWADDIQYEGEEDVREFASSCSLSIKTTVFPPEASDRNGRGYVEATLCDKNGVPMQNREIKLASSCGVLSCQQPGWYDNISSISSDRTCYVTGADGKIQVYIINIPFNTPGRVKASSSCGDITVTGSSTFKIMRTQPKKKSAKKKTP